MVTEMLAQSVDERTNSIAEIKRKLIGREIEFANLQRLSELKQTVVPVTDIDDPLVIDPPYLRDIDYQRGLLILYLSRPVNDKWIFEMRNMRDSFTSVWNKGPERFNINGDRASIKAVEGEAQQIVSYFKNWLPIADHQYAQTLWKEQLEEQERQRRELQKEIEELERQRRGRANVRI